MILSKMTLFPAIDLKDGNCVRLFQGDMDKSTVFSDSPADQAKAFENEGARWIHIVDLNGAFEGKPVNLEAVKSILNNVRVPLQLGGGIRNIETIKMWIDAGISRVILGTSAIKNPELIFEACKQFPGKIALGIDAKNGFVAIEGWAEVSDVSAVALAKKFENIGLSAIIYTDISKDGAMAGPNIEATQLLAESVNIPVIVSGGVSKLEDLKAIRATNCNGIMGAISGRALYEKAFSIANANKILEA